MSLPPTSQPTDTAASDSEQPLPADEQQARRAALQKIGKFTTYAAPAMLALLSHRAAAGS